MEIADRDSKGSTLHQPRVQDVDLELCVHLMTLQTGRQSTKVDLLHRHSEVLGGSPTEVRKAQDQPPHGSCRSFDINNRRLVASSDMHQVNLLLSEWRRLECYRIQRSEATRCLRGRGTEEDTSPGKENRSSLDTGAAVQRT